MRRNERAANKKRRYGDRDTNGREIEIERKNIETSLHAHNIRKVFLQKLFLQFSSAHQLP